VVDESSEGPKTESPVPEAHPSALPESQKKGRHPLLIGIVIGAVGIFAVLGVIGYVLGSNGSEVLLEEDFSSDDPEFSTDSDPLVDFSVENDAYHILIKDASVDQFARHIFDISHDGLKFEATVRLPRVRDSFFSVGCWSGEHAYVLMLFGSGNAWVVETARGSTGRIEPHPLTDGVRTDTVDQAGEPIRLRIDCVGGGSEPTVVSGWINGEPIASVAVPEGFDSFDAVGFYLSTDTDGAEFVVDDVIASAERPAPAESPVPPSGD
jgi:hypothetical protein